MAENIFLIGFSGVGKSTVGKKLALMLGMDFVDIDKYIVDSQDRTIKDIFASDGERKFRKIEYNSLKNICQKTNQVVSTGGGLPVYARNRNLMKENGVIICLEAHDKTLNKRLFESDLDGSFDKEVRPKLDSDDKFRTLSSLKQSRQKFYSMCDWTIHTDKLTPDQIAIEIIRFCNILPASQIKIPVSLNEDLSSIVSIGGEGYPIYVGWGILTKLSDILKDRKMLATIFIIADESVLMHTRKIQILLESNGFKFHTFRIPSGESSKNLDLVKSIYGWLAELNAERSDMILAVGGGVVGDISGFVAATYLRGIKFAQIPTTLLAMTDSSIGGKTGVDLPEGKNLVGAFHQPEFILADLETLKTLSQRELNSGWAESIKHGLILDKNLFYDMQNNSSKLLSLEKTVTLDVLKRSMKIKADVVSKDEKEQLGLRIILNYGHTIGHAIEASTKYGLYLHGEAVSIGVVGAAMLSSHLGFITNEEVDLQKSVFKLFDLPTSYNDLDIDSVIHFMSVDKKRSAGNIRWVILEAIGNANTTKNVSIDSVKNILKELKK
ncbi:MAG: 3-dehydroquinate synthase [SAR202 cluster bacterium]|nr:3-dehydroquinate synthase [SAR202 cluster bacterium]|tara:strand:+ start:24095 stop:25750 length:1656 start_codon:yes stop_codon:yes gene_type:complete